MGDQAEIPGDPDTPSRPQLADWLWQQIRRFFPKRARVVWVAGLLVIGAISLIASNWDEAWLRTLRTRLGLIRPVRAELVIDGIDGHVLDFSILNPSASSHLQLTAIYLEHLRDLDLCSICVASDRTPLRATLSAGVDQLAQGSLKTPGEQIYGRSQTYSLEPGETASFTLSLDVRNNGGVFRLAFAVNNVEAAAREVLSPMAVFLADRDAISIYGVDAWPDAASEGVRREIARALLAARDPGVLDGLIRTATSDTSHDVACVAAETLLSLASRSAVHGLLHPDDDQFDKFKSSLQNGLNRMRNIRSELVRSFLAAIDANETAARKSIARMRSDGLRNPILHQFYPGLLDHQNDSWGRGDVVYHGDIEPPCSASRAPTLPVTR